MTPEQFRKIEELFDAAQKCGPGERVGLLEGTDPEIRNVVERMLAQASSNQILDSPAFDLLDPSTETVNAGSQFGPYKIEALIGAGGMGAVYRAVDTRLGRLVAVKVAEARYSRQTLPAGGARHFHAEPSAYLHRGARQNAHLLRSLRIAPRRVLKVAGCSIRANAPGAQCSERGAAVPPAMDVAKEGALLKIGTMYSTQTTVTRCAPNSCCTRRTTARWFLRAPSSKGRLYRPDRFASGRAQNLRQWRVDWS